MSELLPFTDCPVFDGMQNPAMIPDFDIFGGKTNPAGAFVLKPSEYVDIDISARGCRGRTRVMRVSFAVGVHRYCDVTRKDV